MKAGLFTHHAFWLEYHSRSKAQGSATASARGRTLLLLILSNMNRDVHEARYGTQPLPAVCSLVWQLPPVIAHKILRNNKSKKLHVRKHPTYGWAVYTRTLGSHVRETLTATPEPELSPQTWVWSPVSTTATEPVLSPELESRCIRSGTICASLK